METARLREKQSYSWKRVSCAVKHSASVPWLRSCWCSDYEPTREGVDLVQNMTTKCFTVSSCKPKRRVSFKKCECVQNCWEFFFSLFFCFYTEE